MLLCFLGCYAVGLYTDALMVLLRGSLIISHLTLLTSYTYTPFKGFTNGSCIIFILYYASIGVGVLIVLGAMKLISWLWNHLLALVAMLWFSLPVPIVGFLFKIS